VAFDINRKKFSHSSSSSFLLLLGRRRRLLLLLIRSHRSSPLLLPSYTHPEILPGFFDTSSRCFAPIVRCWNWRPERKIDP